MSGVLAGGLALLGLSLFVFALGGVIKFLEWRIRNQKQKQTDVKATA